jgi:hypothetical protein
VSDDTGGPVTRREIDIAREAYARCRCRCAHVVQPTVQPCGDCRIIAAKNYRYPTRTVTRPRIEPVQLAGLKPTEFKLEGDTLAYRFTGDDKWIVWMDEKILAACRRLIANPTETVTEEVEDDETVTDLHGEPYTGAAGQAAVFTPPGGYDVATILARIESNDHPHIAYEELHDLAAAFRGLQADISRLWIEKENAWRKAGK